MWLKFIGSLFILAAATFLGFRAAVVFAERPGQIRQTVSCLSALRSQISYLACPLPEALVKSANGIEGPVARWVENIGGVLGEKSSVTPGEAMCLAYERSKEQLALKRPELEVLAALFANLGSTDREEQQKALALAECQLSRLQEEAREFCAQNVKMCRYLGVCGGLALIIIFL